MSSKDSSKHQIQNTDLRISLDEAQVVPVNQDLLYRNSSKASFVLPCPRCLGLSSTNDALIFVIEAKDGASPSMKLQGVEINPSRSHDSSISEVYTLIYDSKEDTSIDYKPDLEEIVLKAQKARNKRKFKVRSIREVSWTRANRDDHKDIDMKIVRFYFKVNDYFDGATGGYIPIVGNEAGLFDVTFWNTGNDKWYIKEIASPQQDGYNFSRNLLIAEWERSHKILEANKLWKPERLVGSWFTMKCPECFSSIDARKPDKLLMFRLANYHGGNKDWPWPSIHLELTHGGENAPRRAEGIPFGINCTQVSTIAKSVPPDYGRNAQIFNYGAPFKYHNITFKYKAMETVFDHHDKSSFTNSDQQFYTQTVWLNSIDGRAIEKSRSPSTGPGFQIVYYHLGRESGGMEPVMVKFFGEAYPSSTSSTPFSYFPFTFHGDTQLYSKSLLASYAFSFVLFCITGFTLFKVLCLLKSALGWMWRRLQGDAAEEDYWTLKDEDADSDGDGYMEDGSEKIILDYVVAVDNDEGKRFKVVGEGNMEVRPRSRKNTTRQIPCN